MVMKRVLGCLVGVVMMAGSAFSTTYSGYYAALPVQQHYDRIAPAKCDPETERILRKQFNENTHLLIAQGSNLENVPYNELFVRELVSSYKKILRVFT